MRLGLLFVILGLALVGLGVIEGGHAYLLLWPALSFLVVAAGYLGLGARVFGKRADGTLPILTRIVLAPYLGLAWIIWQALRRSTVKPYSLVSPGLYLARRLHHHELPEGVEIVVDLTAEFPVAARVREGRVYYALPALDGHVPDEKRWRELVDEVASSDATALVHCAAGHGRSAGFVAAVLMRRGVARDVDHAERIIKEVRPSIRIGPVQRQLVMRTVTRA
jgi:protein-tyrosine phosphatase